MVVTKLKVCVFFLCVCVCAGQSGRIGERKRMEGYKIAKERMANWMVRDKLVK